MPMLPWLMRNQGGFMPEVMTRQPQPAPQGPGNFMPESLTRAPEAAQPAAPQQAGGLLGGGLTPEMGALLALGAGLLQNRDKRVGEGLGAGVMNAMNTYTGLQGAQRVRDRLDRQDRQEQQRLDQEAAKAQALEGAIVGLPPDQQATARGNPDAFFKAKADLIFRPQEAAKAPDSRTVKIGGETVTQEWDAENRRWNEVGRGASFAPQRVAGDGTTSRMLTPDEVKQWGFREGTVVSIDSKGNPQVEQSPPGNNQGITIGPDGTVQIGGSGGKPPAGYRWTAEGNLEKIPGGPADDVSADMAGRVAAIEGGRKQLGEVEEFYFPGGELNPDSQRIDGGEYNRSGAGKVSLPLPGIVGGGQPVLGGGAQRAQIDGMIDSIIRLRTGAGLNAYEPEYYRSQYMPSATDNDATAREKLRQLRIAMEEAAAVFNRGRPNQPAPGPTPQTGPIGIDQPPVPGATRLAPGAAPSPGGIPQAAIDALRANPGLIDQFEQKYGSGSGFRALGGG